MPERRPATRRDHLSRRAGPSPYRPAEPPARSIWRARARGGDQRRAREECRVGGFCRPHHRSGEPSARTRSTDRGGLTGRPSGARHKRHAARPWLLRLPSREGDGGRMNLPEQLITLGLRATAERLQDLVAQASEKRWSPTQVLERVAALEL